MTKNKILKNFTKQWPVYDEFTTLIKNTIKSLLKEHGFKPQKLTPRTKKTDSLKKNLNIKGRYKSLSKIYDLSGCRVVFYLEKDIELFAPILQKNFTIVEQQLKYSKNNYNAKHIVIRLNKKTSSLKKYLKYKNFTCEVQLTTVLDHAWSELNHDIAYKISKELNDFDKDTINKISGSFNEVMENHIHPSNQILSFITQEFEDLKTAKKLFDIKFLEKLSKSHSNNKILKNLNQLCEAIERYGNKIPKAIPVTKLINSILQKVELNPIEPKKDIQESSGSFTSKIITLKLFRIINYFRYTHVKYTFNKIIFFSRSKTPEIKSYAFEVLSNLTKYNPQVYEDVGTYFQFFVLNKMENWSNEKLERNLELALVASRELLQLTAESGATSSANKYTFSTFTLPPNKKIKEIRSKTLKLLGKAYYISKNDYIKKEIIKTISISTELPRDGINYKIKRMLVSNAGNSLSLYLKFFKSGSLPIISLIEAKAHQIATRFPNKHSLKINKLKILLKNNSEYSYYKIFVGHDHFHVTVLGKQDREDHRKIKAYREDRIKKYIKAINSKNISIWKQRILNHATYFKDETDRSRFNHFWEFLRLLANQKPLTTKALIEENENALEPVLIPLLEGLKESSQELTFQTIILKLIKTRERLFTCARAFELRPPVNPPLLQEIFKEAKKQDNVAAIASILCGIGRNYDNSPILKLLFIKSIIELTKHETANWVYSFSLGENSILLDLNKNDNRKILNNLVFCPELEHPDEEILIHIANKQPEDVISFFLKRMKLQLQKNSFKNYSSIPFNLHNLGPALKSKKIKVTPLIIKIFLKKGRIYQREAARLIKAIFPDFDKHLETKLIELVRTKKTLYLNVVFEILRLYEGKPYIHRTCKEIVKNSTRTDNYKSRVKNLLWGTGTVTGTYGFANAYEKKISEIQGWKKSRFAVIRNFAIEVQNDLEQDVLNHQKSADKEFQDRQISYDWITR